MFAVTVELLTGRYTAQQFNDRDRPEWPPHPARFFSALVAAWADSDEPDPAERTALRWLEDQDPPAIRCGDEVKRRAVVTHFVPVNDATALTRDTSASYHAVAAARAAVRDAEAGDDPRVVKRMQTALVRAEAKALADAAKAGSPTGRETANVTRSVLEVLPENRGKQGRTYPTILPDDSTVWFIWPAAEPSEQQFTILDGLLARVGRIGHSSTLVSCGCSREAPDPTWIPGSGTTRLRVPRNGSVEALEDAYATHRGEEPRTLPAGMVFYGTPADQGQDYRSPLLGGDWYVMAIEGRRLPSATRALAIARATRAAIQKHGEQPPPSFISGHKQSSEGQVRTPPLEREHLAIVPLINAGNRYSDGSILGVALVLPAATEDDDQLTLERALNAWRKAGAELGLSGEPEKPWKLDDARIDRTDPETGSWDRDLPRQQRTLTRGYWCRPARRWMTVTPIALDRFPGNLRSTTPRIRDRAEAEAEESVVQACLRAGLAERSDDVRVSIRLDAPLTAIPAAPSGKRSGGQRQYPVYRTGDGTPRACVHAEIEFEEPVRGPVLIGAGRYFGYGLCLPCDETGE
jgi:CRISPR-associated protein Csb2